MRLAISRRHLNSGQPSCPKSSFLVCKPVSLEKNACNAVFDPFQGQSVLFPSRREPCSTCRTGIFQNRVNIVNIERCCYRE